MHVNARRVSMRRGQEVGRALDAEAALVQCVRVDHCGPNVFVAQEFLHGTDVIAGLDQMCGGAMPECVGRHPFCNIRATHCGGNCPNDCRGVQFRRPGSTRRRPTSLDHPNRSESVCQELFQRTCRESSSRLADGDPADGNRTSGLHHRASRLCRSARNRTGLGRGLFLLSGLFFAPNQWGFQNS